MPPPAQGTGRQKLFRLTGKYSEATMNAFTGRRRPPPPRPIRDGLGKDLLMTLETPMPGADVVELRTGGSARW